jgi:hypothetical protein
MADGDGRVALQKKLRKGSAHYLTASDDTGVRAADRNPVSLQEFYDANGSARRKRLLS